jgi:hypothetical protein
MPTGARNMVQRPLFVREDLNQESKPSRAYETEMCPLSLTIFSSGVILERSSERFFPNLKVVI